MKSVFKNTFATLMSMLFLVSVSGLSYFKHSCDTCQTSYVYFTDSEHTHHESPVTPDNCCSTQSETKCTMSQSEAQNNCCSDTHFSLKLDSPFSLSSLNLEIHPTVSELPQAYLCHFLLLANQVESKFSYLHTHPPEIQTDISELSVFRI